MGGEERCPSFEKDSGQVRISNTSALLDTHFLLKKQIFKTDIQNRYSKPIKPKFLSQKLKKKRI